MRKIEEVYEIYDEDLKIEYEIVKELRTNIYRIRKATFDPYGDYEYEDGLLSQTYIKNPNVRFKIDCALTEDIFNYEMSKRNRKKRIIKQLKDTSKILVDMQTTK